MFVSPKETILTPSYLQMDSRACIELQVNYSEARRHLPPSSNRFSPQNVHRQLHAGYGGDWRYRG